MKILVPIKQVADPDHASRIGVTHDAKEVDCSALERRINPFDEYALEAALRLTEDGRNSKQRLGEIHVVTLGPKNTETMLRSALATGADSAIRIDATDAMLDGRLVAKSLAQLVARLGVDLVLMGKQTVDGDGNEVAQRLAAILDWPQSTFTASILEEADGTLTVEREVDGGTCRLSLILPAVVSVDLRIVAPRATYSKATPRDYVYPPGVRFASLPSIMQAKRKPLELLSLSEIIPDDGIVLRHIRYSLPQARPAGRLTSSVDELLDWLTTEAKVL